MPICFFFFFSKNLKRRKVLVILSLSSWLRSLLCGAELQTGFGRQGNRARGRRNRNSVRNFRGVVVNGGFIIVYYVLNAKRLQLRLAISWWWNKSVYWEMGFLLAKRPVAGDCKSQSSRKKGFRTSKAVPLVAANPGHS